MKKQPRRFGDYPEYSQRITEITQNIRNQRLIAQKDLTKPELPENAPKHADNSTYSTLLDRTGSPVAATRSDPGDPNHGAKERSSWSKDSSHASLNKEFHASLRPVLALIMKGTTNKSLVILFTRL
jgi:hypothetical protein